MLSRREPLEFGTLVANTGGFNAQGGNVDDMFDGTTAGGFLTFEVWELLLWVRVFTQ
jgi:hypothetical protein